eukprot:2143139-Ditylum_brightwellii.AAC.1
MVSQLSVKEDVLNWQLRINVAKVWMMVGALNICCKKSHVSQLYFPVAPSSTGLSLANLTVMPD